MRISVRSRCRTSVKVPCSFCLGSARHPVVAIESDRHDLDADTFEVRILDGRRFVLCHRLEPDQWELAAVHARMRRRPARSRARDHALRSAMVLHAAALLLWRLGPTLVRRVHRSSDAKLTELGLRP